MQKKLIFLVGPTGSGKSKLKETIKNGLDIGNENCISVDDIFETDNISKEIFHKLYEHHFNKIKKFIDINNIDYFKTCISQNIDYESYLYKINEELIKAGITNDCVIQQIQKRYHPEKNSIPFSQFTSAVYFALREKYLNDRFDIVIEECIKLKKDIIIESNGEHINSIIGWYQEPINENTKNNKEYEHCKTPLRDLREDINKNCYEKHVYFLYRPVDEIKNSMISRAFVNMIKFLNDKKINNIPRLPEIDDGILNEKFNKICSVYNEINNNQKKYDITTLIVYNNEYAKFLPLIQEKNQRYFKYCIHDYSCTNGPCTNNGGRGKKRKKIIKKYTQKKQRHFKTRRNYKPKKSRKKNTKKKK